MEQKIKKILFISNHAGFSKFNAPYMKWFKEQGWLVDNVSPGIEIGDYVDNQYNVAITRNPISMKNVLAYMTIKKIVNNNNYTIIHCHTPVGGVLGRLCSVKARKKGSFVIYTAHGFHFYNGSSFFSWLVYYNIEKRLSQYSDCIVTINEEDYSLAKKRFYTDNIQKIDGVGVNLQRFKPISIEGKALLRKHYGFKDEEFILVYVGQFTHDKNHIFLINQIPLLLSKMESLKILFVGGGNPSFCEKYKKIIKDKNLDGVVSFMGYRSDIENLYALSDVTVSVSIREGFGLNLPEGMACGLPVVCSKVRGHIDIVEHSVNGFLFSVDNANEMNQYIYNLYKDEGLRSSISKQNIIDVEKFSVVNSVNAMSKIYQKYM